MDDRVAHVAQLIARHPRIRVRELASSVHLSPSRLQHIFKAEMGVPIKQFSRSKLCALAMSLLTNRHVSIKEIHIQLGFPDPCTFSRWFKASCGLSPSRYRNGSAKADGSIPCSDPAPTVTTARFHDENVPRKT